jgi:spermidine synthase
MNKQLFTLLFFISGLCGLMYQILWTRLFSFALGNTYAAISIIIASFMFGLFFGAWFIGRYIIKISNPLKLYAYLEILIGACAVLMLISFGAVSLIYKTSSLILQDFGILNLGGKFIITLLLLIIPTGAMGATLPLAVQYFTKNKTSFEENISIFYAMNTFGGALGTLIAGFIIIEFLGINNGIMIAAILNFLIGLYALYHIKRFNKEDDQKEIKKVELKNFKQDKIKGPDTKSDKKHKASEKKQGLKILLLLTAGLSGYTAFSYEIIWTRGLKFIMLNSTYGFSCLLFVFLLGIAIGGIYAKKIKLNSNRLLNIYGILQIVIGIYAIFTIYILYSLAYTTGFQDSVGKLIYDYSFGWGWGIIAFILTGILIFMIPALAMGILFPLLNNIYFKSVSNKSGKTVSSIYAINTIGAIAGALSAGFLLIPVLGIKLSIYLIAIINLGLGFIFVFRSGLNLRPALLISVPLLILFYSLSVKGNYLYGNKENESDSILYYKEGLMATVKVYQRNNIRSMSIDGIPIASTSRSLMQKEKLIAHLPFFLKQNPGKVLAVGLASGISAGSMTLHPGVKRIDCVELIKPVFIAAKYFLDENRNIFDNNKVNLVYNDIYSYLLNSDEQYDLISSDGKLGSLHSGNTIMLSADYYELCKERMKKDGVFVQWIPIITPSPALKIIINTLSQTFNYVSLFYFYPSDIFMAASESPIVLDKSYIDQVLKNEPVKAELEKYNVFDSYAILSAYVGNYNNQSFPDLQINSFNQPALEFKFLRDWKKSRQYKGGYRAKNLEFITANFENMVINTFIKSFRNVNEADLKKNLYLPTLSFLKFATANFITGNYQLGLSEYIKFKKEHSF